MNTPVELPTARQSRNFHQFTNIHDPNWIPVLTNTNKTSPRSQSSTPYFDTTPRFPSRGSSRPATPKDGASKSKTALSTVPQELDAGPVASTRSRHGFSEPHNRQRSRETEDTFASSSDDTTFSADAPSTAGTGSILENQTYTLPRSALKESRSFTQSSSLSDRSSIISNPKRPAVPTSRYNRKPGVPGSVPATPTTNSPPVFAQSLADSPRVLTLDTLQPRKMSSPSLHELSLLQAKPTSPISLYSSTHTQEAARSNHVVTTTALADSATQSPPRPPPALQELPGESPASVPARLDAAIELPTTALPQLPPEPPSYELSTNKNRKSTASVRTTASVRKKRALHSHPSNPSLRSEKIESSADVNTSQVPLPSNSLRRTRTNESKRSVATDAGPPTVAPAGPLPQLPPKVASKRPSTRHRMQKTSEGNLSLFPQQTSLSHSPSVANSIAKSETGPQQSPPTLYYSPSSFSLAASATNLSSDQQQLQHRHNKSEANTIPHKELADFMTSKSTLIFRRFDDMHVKLLLSIQDEIAALERELLVLEAASQQKTSDDSEDEYDEDEDDYGRDNKPSLGEKGVAMRRKSTKRERPRSSRGIKETSESKDMKREKRKIKIMAELRRLLAEYDHLYSNWSAMQKTPATLRDRRDLERYLSDDIGTSETARSDLLWAERNADDLSCVNVGINAGNDGNSVKSKSSPWSKNKAKPKVKGLSLGMRSTSFSTNTGGAPASGMSNPFNEKILEGRRRNSVLGSWFGSCTGRRK